MTVCISADIEGVNNIATWDETSMNSPEYQYFRKQMTEEVAAACRAAKEAGATEILVKDAHDSARNLILKDLPEYVKLHRGWEGVPCSMMAGLDKSFDAVMFIGYHSPASSEGNPLSHTMNLRNQYVKINGILTSEFYINALYSSYLGVPVAFLSGDKELTRIVKEANEFIETVVTKEGSHGAVISEHPSVTNKRIEETVKKALTKDLSKNIVELPKHFTVEIQYKKFNDAFNASFYPGCTQISSDTVVFESDDYYEVVRALKFIL